MGEKSEPVGGSPREASYPGDVSTCFLEAAGRGHVEMLCQAPGAARRDHL